jgi:hypothetical protein
MEETINVTVRSFGEMHKVEQITANGALKFLVAVGVAKRLPDAEPVKGKKGKAAAVYEIPVIATFNNK